MDYNTLFISDVHLGSKSTQSDKLFKFLSENTFNKIYLVGDIINMEKLKEKFVWRRKHNAVVYLLLKLSKHIEIIYIYGKTDMFLYDFIGERFGNIIIKSEDIHFTSKHGECLVTHGHQFENILFSYLKFKRIGVLLNDIILSLNKNIIKVLKFLGLSMWSLSVYLKSKSKTAKNYIENFEEIASLYAEEKMVSIIITGHTHIAADKIINNIRYINCGCWTEFTSCVVEDIHGELILLNV